MNIELPTPTQFDGRNPQFCEWAGEAKSYLSIHNVHIEDIMDDSTKSIAAIIFGNIQNEYTEEDRRRLNTKFSDCFQLHRKKMQTIATSTLT
eukprot:2465061-Amphidinium_carterae.5